MDEKEIYEILSSYKQAIDLILERLDGMDKMYHDSDARVDEIEKVLFEQILGPAQEMYDQSMADERFNDFNDKYGEKLSSYNSALAPMEDENFDLSRATFDAYDALPEEERPDEEAYVNEVARIAEEKIAQIKEALGIPSDAATEIKDDGEGNVEVKVDENGDGVPETEVGTETETEVGTETETEVTTEEDEGEPEKEEVSESEEAIDDPEEIKKFEEELKKEL